MRLSTSGFSKILCYFHKIGVFLKMGMCMACLSGEKDDYQQPSPVRIKRYTFKCNEMDHNDLSDSSSEVLFLSSFLLSLLFLIKVNHLFFHGSS